MTDAGGRRTLDEMLDALADVQRRTLLVALLEHNPQDDDPVVVSSEDDADEIERLVRMDHVHLPKLDNYGFIEWDEQANEVAKGPNFAEIRPLLELLDAHDDELPPGWL